MEFRDISLKESIKNKLLSEMDLESLRNQLRNQKAKIMNLQHFGHGTYKNPAGHEFTWDNSKNDFVLVKKNNIVQFPSNTKSDKPYKISDGTVPGFSLIEPINADWKKVENFFGVKFDTIEDEKGYGNTFKIVSFADNEKYTVYARDGKLRIGGEDKGKNYDYLKKSLEVNSSSVEVVKQPEKKSMFNNPPEGGWTDADKVPEKYHDMESKQKEWVKQNKELLKSQDVYNKKRGDTFKQIVRGVFDKEQGKEREYTIDKIMNLHDRKVFHGKGFRIEIPHPTPETKPSPELTQKVKDHVTDVLSKDNTEIKDVSDEGTFWKDPKKLISDNWGLRAVDSYGDLYFNIYSNPENIGRRGKIVKQISFTQNVPRDSRRVWISTIMDKIKEQKPKSFEDLEKFLEKQFEEVRSQEVNTRPLNKYVNDLKGIDRNIPDFGLEGGFEDFKGHDVSVTYSKPEIEFFSASDEKQSGGFSHPKVRVKWHNAKKIDKLKDQLKNANNLDGIIKILRDNGVKFNYSNYTDSQYT